MWTVERKIKQQIVDLSICCLIFYILNRGFDYSFVDLGMSDQEIAIFDQLKIIESEEYNRYGNIELIKEEFPQFLTIIGNDDKELTEAATQILWKIVSNVIAAFGKESAWICVRSSEPHHYWDIPRWHMDGYYYSS